MENQWLQLNKRKIDAMQYQLTELAFKNENPGVPLAQYMAMIGEAIIEIKKLQEQINALTTALSKSK